MTLRRVFALAISWISWDQQRRGSNEVTLVVEAWSCTFEVTNLLTDVVCDSVCEDELRITVNGDIVCDVELRSAVMMRTRTCPLTPPHLYLCGAGTASAAAALTVAAPKSLFSNTTMGHDTTEEATNSTE